MKTAISKKTVTIITALLSILALVLIITGVTYAVWKDSPSVEQDVDVPLQEINPSAKYIVYHALDADGNFTDGTPVAYAVVGYTGLIAELVVPSVHEGKPVTKICTSAEDSEYPTRLNGNSIVTSITIPESVIEISAGACQNMRILKSVTIEGSSAIAIGRLAFANCPLLSSFQTQRPISADSDDYLLGSPQ